MKYSYLWLKELSGTKKSPKELAERLTMRAFELEETKTEGKETQLEFAILPNRGHDALSHMGMAREICAVEERKFILRSDLRMTLRPDLRRALKVEIKDSSRSSSGGAGKKLCSRYIGAVLENIKVGPSPKWMQERLLVCGVKPINNIVDITNYVMLETGQPLHAFDKSKVKSQKSKADTIVVRKATKGEEIKLLDEEVYKLTENDLVIADGEKPIALAGVMGGYESSVTSKTKSIILESANFNSTNIRKTRTRHNITTESSYRFEREIDPNLAELGAARAIELLEKYGGKNVHPVKSPTQGRGAPAAQFNRVKVVAMADIYPKKIKPWTIKLDPDYANHLLGEKIPAFRMKKILENLGLRALGNLVSKLTFEVPTFRIDLKTQEDLIEEIGRIYGYENIKEQAPRVELSGVKLNKKRIFEDKLRDIMTGLGFSEVMNYSFYGADDIEKCKLKLEDHIEVENPLSSDQQYLRWSLTPNLLKNAALNLKNFSDLKIFEIGNKFQNGKSSPKESTVLVGAMTSEAAKDSLFFELKGKVEAVFGKLGYKNISYREIKKGYIFGHQSRTAEIVMRNAEIGRVGEVNPIVLRSYGIKKRVAIFGIKISDLLEAVLSEETRYKPISKFPVVERDLSMFVKKGTRYNEIEMKINEVGGNLVKNIALFDIFEKEGEKSLALRLAIGSDAKTLTSAEIDAVMEKIISSLEKDLKVKVRK